MTEPTTEAGLAPSEGLLRMIADWLSRPAEVGSIRDSLRLLVAKETILVLEAEAIAAERARIAKWLIDGNNLIRKDQVTYRSRGITVGEMLDFLDIINPEETER